MGLCSSQARPLVFGERGSFAFHLRSPSSNNCFEIIFAFDSMSTMSSIASELPQTQANGNSYAIRIRKHQEQIETSLGGIGSQIETAFRVAADNNFTKIVFIEPPAET